MESYGNVVWRPIPSEQLRPNEIDRSLRGMSAELGAARCQRAIVGAVAALHRAEGDIETANYLMAQLSGLIVPERQGARPGLVGPNGRRLS